MKTFYIKTLGCKVNQYESDGICLSLEKKGLEKTQNATCADIYIINTCAVTSKAGMQSRQAIRKIIRENPQAKVIVTGCHAQTDPDQIKAIDHIDQIISQSDKTKIAAHIFDVCGKPDALPFKPADHTVKNCFHSFDDTVKGEMTRAYLKIQDGCNAFCTYCIVPYARGSSVSMPQDEVFAHLKNLNQDGFKEVILTGIHAGMYGLDFNPKSSLLDLLENINDLRPVHRIRLSSIEPGEINDGIIKLAGPGNIVCDHFHVPLQSGDDGILKKMKRHYTAAMFEDTILKIHAQLPHGAIGIDVLVGFPTETTKQFENTYKLIEKLPISYLHVFPFSARKGTPAWHFKPKVSSQKIKDRCALLRQLGREKQQAFIQKNLNKPLEGLVQNAHDARTGRIKAMTSNYLTVLLDKRHDLKGKIVDIIPEKFDPSFVISGKIIHP